MKRSTKSLHPALTALALTLACSGGHAATPEPVKPDNPMLARLSESYGKLPLSFEANEGQQDQQVKFLSRGSGYNLFLTNQQVVLVLTKSEKPVTPGRTRRPCGCFAEAEGPIDRFTHAVGRCKSKQPGGTGEGKVARKVNYFTGMIPRNGELMSDLRKVRLENRCYRA